MAVFRIERTRDYTVMSNHHLRDKGLSLKSKGLLSMMLSLPEDWNYTTRGLAKICKEGVDAIGGALLGVAMLVTYSPQNGVILLVIAFMVSPLGLPMAAAWLVGKVQDLRYMIQDAVYG